VSKWVYVVGGAVFAILMAVSTRYGFHRDELYFLDCARHLQASYVDQPIFVPLLAKLSLTLFGPSLPGLRLWAALAAFGTVVLGGLIARELGGGRRSQVLAALATAAMPVVLAADHLFGPTAFDLLAWAALALVALRVERTGNPRWWLLAGLILGVGLADKHSVGFLAVALVAGLLLSGGRRLITNRWFLLGAVIAALFTIPDIWWQARHEWATVAMTQELNRENGGLGHIPDWVVGQLLMAAVWIWAVGLVFLWRSRLPMRRALVWAYAILFVFFAVTSGAKIYYVAGLYVPLLAAGTVSVDAWLARGRWRIWAYLAPLALVTVASAPLFLPVLPPDRIGWTYDVNETLAESVGWPQLAGQVRDVWRTLPADQRASAVIFTSNYGEAGAIDTFDRDDGMPAAVSGHNSYWWWGPGNPDAQTVIAVMPGPVNGTGYDERLRKLFTGVREAAVLTNPYGLVNQEWQGHVYVCTGPRRPWGEMWRELRFYG